MAHPIALELRLDERRPDRVFVTVVLSPSAPAPDGTSPIIGGVAVQMFTRGGQNLSARLLLPIAGQLGQPMASTVELRALDEIPSDSRVIATAWWTGGQLEASCPTDPWTELGTHVRGARPLVPTRDADLRTLDAAERDIMVRLFPWVAEPMIPPEPPTAYFEPSPEDDPDAFVDGIAGQYDLDEESAEWLKELMDED